MEKILAYQKLDNELLQLEKQINTSEDREVMNKMIAYVKDAQNRSLMLEDNAKNLLEDYKQISDIFDKDYKKIKTVIAKDVNELKENKLAETKELASEISDELTSLERKLIAIVNTSKNIMNEFENTKNNALKARSRHKSSRDKLAALTSKLEPQINKIKSEMAKLENGIDKVILTKYKTYRNDNVFPVFVPLNDRRCGYCRMEIPSNKLDKFKDKEFMVCEQCNRLIFKK